MFLYKFDKNQQSLFLGLADKLIKADHVVCKNEERIMEGFKSEVGHFDVNSDLSDENLKNAFKTKEAKAVLMLELIGIAICDGDISEEEKQELKKIQIVLAIGDDAMKQFSDWVNRLSGLYSEAFKLFN